MDSYKPGGAFGEFGEEDSLSKSKKTKAQIRNQGISPYNC